MGGFSGLVRWIPCREAYGLSQALGVTHLSGEKSKGEVCGLSLGATKNEGAITQGPGGQGAHDRVGADASAGSNNVSQGAFN